MFQTLISHSIMLYLVFPHDDQYLISWKYSDYHLLVGSVLFQTVIHELFPLERFLLKKYAAGKILLKLSLSKYGKMPLEPNILDCLSKLLQLFSWCHNKGGMLFSKPSLAACFMNCEHWSSVFGKHWQMSLPHTY